MQTKLRFSVNAEKRIKKQEQKMDKKSTTGLWRVNTTKIGVLESFNSEYDMEAFLMNNPAIIGCDKKEGGGALLRQQLSTRKTHKSGRLDLVGLTNIKDDESGEDIVELCVFELKKGTIDGSAVDQLAEYIDNWNEKNSARKKVQQWLEFEFADKKSILKNLDKIISSPVGVLIGTRFQHDAIEKAQNKGFSGIRIAKFAGASNDQFIVVEDVIGTRTSSRQTIGWLVMLRKNLIKENDTFEISIGNGEKIEAKPMISKISKTSKKLLFTPISIDLLRNKKETIIKKVQELKDKYGFEYSKNIEWLNNGEEPGEMNITTATALVFCAFNTRKLKTFWVSAPLWIHKNSMKSLAELIEFAKE